MNTIKMFALAALASAGLVAGAVPEARVHAQQQPATRPAAPQPATRQPSTQQPSTQQPTTPDDNQSFRFKTGVELINVTATVTDVNGRFVPNLQQDDFRVFQDGE